MNKKINYDSYAGRGRPRKSDYIPARASANDRNYEAELINSTKRINKLSFWETTIIWTVIIGLLAIMWYFNEIAGYLVEVADLMTA